MGVLPLEFQPGQNAASIGLTGRETFDVGGIAEGLKPGKQLTVTATAEDGTKKTFTVTARVDTPDDVEYYRHGGLLPYVLRGLLGAA
jgi:aconitate hydratase